MLEGRNKHSQSTASHTRPKAAARAAVVRHLALAPRKRRPPGLPTHRTARMDVPRGTTGTGVDAGTGTTLATVGLSTELPLLLFQSQTLPTFESRCTKASSACTGHDFANPNHRRLPPA